MIQLSPENIESVGGGYLLLQKVKKAPFLAAVAAINGSSRVEHDAPRNGPVAVGGLLQSLKNLGAVSLAHPLNHALKIFDERLWGEKGSKIAKNPILFPRPR